MSPVGDQDPNAAHRETSAYLRVRKMHGGAVGVVLGVFATGGPNRAKQWREPGRWAVDLEGWTQPFGALDLHVERAFRGTDAGRARALEMARFLEWCIDGLTDEQLAECARETGGRLL